MKPIDPASPSVASGKRLSFEALLDDVCLKLEDARNQGALRRVKKMEDILGSLERELTVILENSGGDRS